jgi:hypothetical protein
VNLFADFWGQLLQVQSAWLPEAALAQAWLRLGWALVLGALLATGVVGVGARRGWSALRQRQLARALALLALLACLGPGPVSPTYWLGLAFQAPSLSAGLLGGLVLLCRCATGAAAQRSAEWLAQLRGWAVAALLLGWLLLLDTLAWWPVALYPLGFGVGAWLALLAVLGVPWAWHGGPVRLHAGHMLLGLVLLVFALLRLPSGNVWDAVLDPWLWLLAQGVVIRFCWICYQKRSALRNASAG